jgi:hypothetical protein
MRIALLLFLCLTCVNAQKYDGPRPPKKDLIYLVHADNLVPTEAGEAKEEGKKDSPIYTVNGANSPARTPMAEPIFILDSDTMTPDRIELYKMDVKGGQRQVKIAVGRRSTGAKALRLTVTKLDRGLYKLEASETLENGEYALSPNGTNHVFCFAVY